MALIDQNAQLPFPRRQGDDVRFGGGKSATTRPLLSGILIIQEDSDFHLELDRIVMIKMLTLVPPKVCCCDSLILIVSGGGHSGVLLAEVGFQEALFANGEFDTGTQVNDPDGGEAGVPPYGAAGCPFMAAAAVVRGSGGIVVAEPGNLGFLACDEHAATMEDKTFRAELPFPLKIVLEVAEEFPAGWLVVLRFAHQGRTEIRGLFGRELETGEGRDGCVVGIDQEQGFTRDCE